MPLSKVALWFICGYTKMLMMSVCLFSCLSACLPVCLPVCLSVCLFVCQPACLPSLCLTACLSVGTQTTLIVCLEPQVIVTICIWTYKHLGGLFLRTHSIFIVCVNERRCLGLSASICVSLCENGSIFMSVWENPWCIYCLSVGTRGILS
jgi:hypothetical protein